MYDGEMDVYTYITMVCVWVCVCGYACVSLCIALYEEKKATYECAPNMSRKYSV